MEIVVGIILVGFIWWSRWSLKREIADLRARVDELERRPAQIPPPVAWTPVMPTEPEPPVEVGEEPTRPVFTSTPPPIPPPIPVPSPEPIFTEEPEPSIPPPIYQPMTSWRDRFQGEEWEVIIGGSLLNKLGALILVIGVALLLRFSLDALGPAGKLAIGAGAGLALLAGGNWIEKRERYKGFAIGFLAAGWAMLYFTAYAAHGIPAARVIQSPALGLAVLLATAAAMIGATLRYRSQWITGLGFISAFAALQLDPASGFALIASAVLAAMLLWLSWRNEWQILPMAGVLMVYAVVAFQPNTPGFLEGIGHPILWLYWALFEVYDLAQARRGSPRGPLAQIQFLLNGMAFVAVSLLAAQHAPPDHYSAFLGLAAMAFAVSFSLRFKWQGGFADDPINDLMSVPGIALTAASLLAMFAVGLRFDGLKQTLGFLVVSQILFLFAWQQGSRFPHLLALALSAFTTAKLCLLDPTENGLITALGYRMNAVSPMLLLATAVLAFDRVAAKRWWYSALALPCATLLIYFEVPAPWRLLGWATLAAALWFWREMQEFRYEAWAVDCLLAVVAVAWLVGAGRHHPLAWAAAGVSLGWQSWTLFRSQLPGRALALQPLTAAAFLLAGCWAWDTLPSPLVGPAWGLLSMFALETAAILEFRELQWCGLIGAWAAGARLLYANFPARAKTGFLSHRLMTVAPFLPLYYYAWWRTRHRAFLWLPPLLAFLLVRFEIGRVNSAIGMTAICVALLWYGQRLNIVDLRWQSYLVALAAFGRAFSSNLRVPGSLAGVPFRILAGALVVAGLLAAHRIARRDAEDVIDRYARTGFAILAAVLAAGLVQFEVAGRALTVAWAMEGAALLALGFLWSERVLRLLGLTLFLVCVVKLFFFDLAALEGIARIVSFIALGALLMAASWLYARFRDDLRKLL